VSGLSIKKEVNITTLITILFAAAAFYFGTTYSVQANSDAHKKNADEIERIKEQTDGLDVLLLRVNMNAKSLARIEAKLDK